MLDYETVYQKRPWLSVKENFPAFNSKYKVKLEDGREIMSDYNFSTGQWRCTELNPALKVAFFKEHFIWA